MQRSRQRTVGRQRRMGLRLPWRELGHVLLLVLAIIGLWYWAWGRFRGQSLPPVRYEFIQAREGKEGLP